MPVDLLRSQKRVEIRGNTGRKCVIKFQKNWDGPGFTINVQDYVPMGSPVEIEMVISDHDMVDFLDGIDSMMERS